MRHSGKISAFIMGAAIGAMAVEAAMCAAYPPVKRMMVKKGMKALRTARNLSERFF